ncbi:MAG: DUF58 domain-containing protein [Oscillospiraceae bacterium]|nr:DUF58 domain-containing protein [Oscillospiraceae bacterium]
MIRNKLLYAVLLAAMLLFWVLYRGKLSQEILIFVAVFPLVLLLAVIRIKHSLSASLTHGKKQARKGESYHWSLHLTNRSIFSTANATADLEYSNSLDGTVRTLRISMPIMPRNTQRIRLSFHAATCGVMHLSLKRVDFSDPLRIFHRKALLRADDSVVIMPRAIEMLPLYFEPQPRPEADSSDFSKVRPGDDPSEIFDLHAYREGDPVSRIHWKLSSKLDTLMVKEYSLPLSAECILLADFRQTGAQPESALRIDMMLSCMTTAVQALAQRDVPFRAAWYRPGYGIGVSDPFRTQEEAAGWTYSVVQSAPLPESEHAGFLTAAAELFGGAKIHDRVLIFLPHADQGITELLLSLPNPERLTVFTVYTPDEAAVLPEHDAAYTAVPVIMDIPLLPDEDDEFNEEEPTAPAADLREEGGDDDD